MTFLDKSLHADRAEEEVHEAARRRALVDAARRVVDERFESLKEPEKVLTAIREDKALSDAVREVALEIATARSREL
jgi:replicative DNA helicase